jgi:hypothetical protein
VLVLCSCLILYGLDRPKLWVDEAETALLARSILVHGIPKARVGHDLISQEVGREFGPDLVWRWTPWLDKYVAAGSFALFGETTRSARLPFALLGIAAVASMYVLALGLFADRRIALFAMLFLGTSVPFLLHVRQCRYYVLAILGTLWSVYFAHACVKRAGWRAPLGLAAALTLVFQANYLTFAALSFSLGVAIWLLGVDRAAFLRLCLAAGVTALLNGPWLFVLDLAGKSDLVARFRPHYLPDYTALIVHYSFPVAALVVFGALAAVTSRWRELLGEWRAPAFLLALPIAYVPVICFGPLVFYRYTANLLPVFALLLAWLAVRAISMQRIAGWIFAALLLVTGVFSELSALPTRYGGETMPGRTSRALDWAFPLGNFALELVHPFEDAMGRVTEFIAMKGKPGDRVFVSYGDLVARFYLDGFEVRGGQSGESLEGWGPPEWIFVRLFFRFKGATIEGSDAQAVLDWLNHSVPWDQYQGIQLPTPDLPFPTIPEPQWHWFRPPTSGDRAFLSIKRR